MSRKGAIASAQLIISPPGFLLLFHDRLLPSNTTGSTASEYRSTSGAQARNLQFDRTVPLLLRVHDRPWLLGMLTYFMHRLSHRVLLAHTLRLSPESTSRPYLVQLPHTRQYFMVLSSMADRKMPYVPRPLCRSPYKGPLGTAARGRTNPRLAWRQGSNGAALLLTGPWGEGSFVASPLSHSLG
jgi:hypothetical protein